MFENIGNYAISYPQIDSVSLTAVPEPSTLIGGALLLIGRYIPLGLVILAPIIVNILIFHITMAPAGIVPGLVATILWFIVFAGHRSSFAGILSANG